MNLWTEKVYDNPWMQIGITHLLRKSHIMCFFAFSLLSCCTCHGLADVTFMLGHRQRCLSQMTEVRLKRRLQKLFYFLRSKLISGKSLLTQFCIQIIWQPDSHLARCTVYCLYWMSALHCCSSSRVWWCRKTLIGLFSNITLHSLWIEQAILHQTFINLMQRTKLIHILLLLLQLTLLLLNQHQLGISPNLILFSWKGLCHL